MEIVTNLQDQVQRRLDELVETELGLQVAVYHQGELVVDAVAGDVTSDTLFYAASTGKAAAATVANVLVDRGVLEYDAPIADLWPEFAANGKQKATLRHVLTHSVGLPALAPDTTADDLTDPAKITSYLAAAEPWWEPGTKMTYHAMTFGYLVGEIVRRATGRRISDVLREIAGAARDRRRGVFRRTAGPAAPGRDAGRAGGRRGHVRDVGRAVRPGHPARPHPTRRALQPPGPARRRDPLRRRADRARHRQAVRRSDR